MAISNARKGLYALAAVIILLGGGWLGWQHYSNQSEQAPAANAPSKSAASSAKPAEDQDKLISDVLVATGLKRQLELLPEQIRAGMQAAPGNDKAPPAVTQEIGKIVEDVFSQQNIQNQIVARLKANFDQKRLQAILDDFSSPLVKRMVAMETKANTPEEQMTFIQNLASKPLSQERIAAIQELDRSTHASDLGTEITLSSIKAMAGAMVGGNKDDLAKLDQTLEQQRSKMEASLHNAILSSMAFTYRDASDADLAAYAKIYDAEHNQWFSNIVMPALSDGIKNASKQVGERLAAMMKSNGMATPMANGSGQQQANQPMPQESKETAKAMAPSKPVEMAKPRKVPSRNRDVRNCLSRKSNSAIAKCVEEHE